MKIEATKKSEKSIELYQTALRQTPENSIMHDSSLL